MPAVGQDVRNLWVEDAVDVARRIGEEEGWDHFPWEELLDELITMEGSAQGAPAGHERSGEFDPSQTDHRGADCR